MLMHLVRLRNHTHTKKLPVRKQICQSTCTNTTFYISVVTTLWELRFKFYRLVHGDFSSTNLARHHFATQLAPAVMCERRLTGAKVNSSTASPGAYSFALELPPMSRSTLGLHSCPAQSQIALAVASLDCWATMEDQRLERWKYKIHGKKPERCTFYL